MTNSLFRATWFVVLAAVSACSQDVPDKTPDIADTIYVDGTILTVNDAQPTAESVAVRDGRILAVGDAESVLVHKGDATEIFDLAGRTMLPGFVDSHGHVVMGAIIPGTVYLSFWA